MRLNEKRIWLFLMLLALAVSGAFLWQAGQRERHVYAGGRIVDTGGGKDRGGECDLYQSTDECTVFEG